MKAIKKLDKAIKQDGINTQSDILSDLKRRYPQYFAQPDKKRAHRKKKRVAVISALVIVIATLLAFVLFLLEQPSIARAETRADDQTWTTTDRLYLQIPDRDKQMTFTTNGGWAGYDVDVFRSVNATKITAIFQVRQWFDVYITPLTTHRWNVRKSDAVDGKWYYDPAKYPLKKNGSSLFDNYAIYIDIGEMPENDNMYTFICSGDETLWKYDSDKFVVKTSCKQPEPKASITTVASSLHANESNPFIDSREAVIGEFSFDKLGIVGHNMQTKPIGINPETGKSLLFIIKSDCGKEKLSFDYYIGAMRQPSKCEATKENTASVTNSNRAPCQREQFSIEFSTTSDTEAPKITTSGTVAKADISATITDNTYCYATYTKNDVEQGEYTSGTKLTAEGKYKITATDAVGNTTVSNDLIVDRTPPRFANEFYDAQGKAVIKYTKETAYVLSYPTATANESAINQTATFVYSYYDSAAKRIVTMPAEYYKKGDKLTKEGRYVITVTDAAGNSSSCTVVVDRSTPTFTSEQYSKSSVYASYSSSEAESPITATYTHTTSSGTSAAFSYTSGMRLSAEGKYTVTATDKAGNSSSVTLFVDNTAPELARSFEYGRGAGSVTFSREQWESEVTAAYSYVGANGTQSSVVYTSGTKLTADGEYTVTATDKAGNSASVKLVVDSKAPSLTFADGTTGTSQITRGSSSVAWKVEKYESPVNVVYSFASADETIAPSLVAAPYASGSMFTAEGTYDFTATDRAGNVTAATVIIDKTPPSLTFSANGIAFERYTNTLFTADGSDALSGIDKIELYENGQYSLYDFAPRSENGAYLFRVSDKAGNVTSATATLYCTDTFGNLASIRDAYKLNAWYTVTLPARIFSTSGNDVAGRYSFESYDKALEFAVQKEWEFRVTPVQGGYMYISATNENIVQKYDDELTLAAVVEKYAKGYISARQTATANGNDRFYIELESLTRNSPPLPDYLLDMKDLSRYYARSSTVWKLPSLPYISEMPYTVTARYLGDFEEETTQNEFLIPSGATLLSAAAEYRQGFYLITERDVAGNVEQYIIYSDAELPTVRVHAVWGDGDSEFVLDYDYAQNETLYFISLGFEAVLDNIDTFVTLKLEKGSTVQYFTQSDELPMLGSEEYTNGKYTVTVYDRSLNALVFDVYIAGAAPSMSHSSLAADKLDCKISFVTPDRYNVITGITLYKIEYDGTKTMLDTDGDGTPVNAATLSYTLTIGGKYGATVTDNYRRTVELTPIFFLKGLPSGKLAGVKDGGRTNKNVSFTFDSSDVAEFYTLHPNGERRTFSAYTIQTGSSQTTYNITADETTSFEYLVFLHNAQDLSLFVEYTFEIDTVLPTFEITDSDGNVIEPDGATNKSFSIKWQEAGVSVRYYTARGGSFAPEKYNMNAVLSQGTLYYFTLKDDVGNTLDFTVLLDNAVDYTLSGKYNAVDGVLYANSPLTLSINEPTQVFDVVNVDEYTIENGGTFTQAGRYDITITDNYRNTVKLVLVLDFTAPTLELDGAESGKAVKNDVAVIADDYNYLYLTDVKGNKLRNVAAGEVFSAAGVYYITASDYAGNIATVTFSIDLSVDYTLSVPNGAVTIEPVTLDTSEPLTVTVKLNGELIDTATRFAAPGEYELDLTDELGNTVSCVFTILSMRMQSVSQQLPNGTRVTAVTKDGISVAVTNPSALDFIDTGAYVVTLDCGGVPYELMLEVDNTPPVVTLTRDGSAVKIAAVDKENVTFTLKFDGKERNCRVGLTLDEPGDYVLTVTDELGNSAVYKFSIPYRLNTWAIIAIVVGAIVLVVFLILIIRARRKPRMK